MDLVALVDRYVGGWPEKDDDRVGPVPLRDILTGRFDTDVHFTAYFAEPPRRHTNASLSAGATIVMRAAVFDVDGPGHEGTDAWWLAERDKVDDLLAEHPGGYAYRTKGGYRVVYALPEPFPVRDVADAERWTRHYDAWCDYLAGFGIVADRACRTWTRLYRAPHTTRDGVVQELETLGDAASVGVWDPPVSPAAAPTVTPTPAPVTTRPADRDDAAVLLARHWPPRTQRLPARLALAGACFYSGMSEAEALDTATHVHALLDDPGDVTDAALATIVATTYAKGERGEAVSGWPRLAKYVGAKTAQTARDLIESDPGAAELALALEAPDAPDTPKPKGGIFWDWDAPLAPIEWLVEGLIPAATVGAFVAHGSSLKTWTVLSIATAVAKGQAWLGRHVVKQGKALVIDYESGSHELRRRVRLLEGGKVDGLGAWTYPEQRIDDAAFWADLARIAIEEGVVLLCVDSLAAGTSSGVDENTRDAARPLELAGRFTEATGAAVIFVHHAKKDDAGDARKLVRGSTAIYAALDWCYTFREYEETAVSRKMFMSNIKPCMGAKPEDVALELTDRGLSSFDVGPKPTKTSPAEVVQDAIRLALSGGPIESKAKIAKRINVRNEAVGPEVDAMVVRREVVFLTGQGYALDDDEHRRQRIVTIVDGYQHWRGVGAIAKAADVDTRDVEACLREGIICRSADGRYLIVRQSASIE